MPLPLQYWNIYNSDDAAAQAKIPFSETSCRLQNHGGGRVACSFLFPSLTVGQWHSLFAFVDANGNQRLDLPSEPCGWWSGRRAGEQGWGIKPFLSNVSEVLENFDFSVHETAPLPPGISRAGTHGLLHHVRG